MGEYIYIYMCCGKSVLMDACLLKNRYVLLSNILISEIRYIYTFNLKQRKIGQ